MNKILLIAFAAGLGLASAVSAQAMPLLPLDQAANGFVMQTAGGCGPGFHRGPHGGCLRNYARPYLHACPRGFHPGPRGCRPNY